jgi:hypothetical protein
MWKRQDIYSKYMTGRAGVRDVISDGVDGTDAGHAAIHTTSRVRSKKQKQKKKKEIHQSERPHYDCSY